MKLTAEVLRQLIREQLQVVLEEGKNYTNTFYPDNAAIYFMDENPDGSIEDPEEDYNKGKVAIKRIPQQSVPFGTPEYKKMKNYYISKGYDFDDKGMTEKVKPPNKTEFVEFIFRYVKAKGE
jgi:hypothetical protein